MNVYGVTDDCEDGFKIIFVIYHPLFGKEDKLVSTIGYYYTPHEALSALVAVVDRITGETQNKDIFDKHFKKQNQISIKECIQEVKDLWDNFKVN